VFEITFTATGVNLALTEPIDPIQPRERLVGSAQVELGSSGTAVCSVMSR
jgi:hypothetical protein